MPGGVSVQFRVVNFQLWLGGEGLRITIDNGDGAGALDYTGAVVAEGRVRVERMLNAPSRCTATVLVGALPLPARLARVAVSRDDGAVLFTGYVATEPVRVPAGMGTEGLLYTARVTAVSDEWLLDRQGSGAAAGGGPSLAGGGPSLALDGTELLARLALRAGGGIAVAGDGGRKVASFWAREAVPWSVNAGDAAGAAYAGYRALAGQVLVQAAGAVSHRFGDAVGDGGVLDVNALQVANVRELANDVTLTGAEEPAAYVQECFAGDGATMVFELSERGFAAKPATAIDDSFAKAAFNPAVWTVGDPGSHLGLTAAGLTMNGGNGADGVTTLTALDALEMGGTLLVELSGVQLGAACDGMLAGLYSGLPVLAECFAGFRVRQQNAATTLVPVVNGVEVGTAFAPAAGHSYTLRLRLHCAETQRVMEQYYVMVDGVVQEFGAPGGVDAGMDAVFEVVDQGASSNTPATVLYDSANVGAVTGTPATCAFVVANCTEMFGSIARVRVTRPGTLWVTSVLPSGVRQTRLLGAAGTGADCVAVAGVAPKVTFFAGRVPQPGERVEVACRSVQRSVARMQNAASVAREALGGAAGTCRWLGKVLQPEARSSADCESAAAAVLAFASARTAAVAGTYATVNPAADVWPGDVLAVSNAGLTSSLLVRRVAVEDGGAVPEVLRYGIAFANDWATEYADSLGVKLSETVEADAVLPEAASDGPAAVLESLVTLRVTGLNGSALTLDAGLPAPVGGGFEVRRRDAAFGPGSDADLILRSPVRGFSIPRAAQVERFYVRMYDASTPPVYSRFSAGVLVNWPVG